MSRYQITIKGRIDPGWSEWFDNLAVSYDKEDNTVLAGIVVDQPALHGILDRIRDLNLILVSVELTGMDEAKDAGEFII
jgi:hypothetical protein